MSYEKPRAYKNVASSETRYFEPKNLGYKDQNKEEETVTNNKEKSSKESLVKKATNFLFG